MNGAFSSLRSSGIHGQAWLSHSCDSVSRAKRLAIDYGFAVVKGQAVRIKLPPF